MDEYEKLKHISIFDKVIITNDNHSYLYDNSKSVDKIKMIEDFMNKHVNMALLDDS